MKAKVASPIRPGEILLEQYLKPLGVSQNAVARALGITPKTVSEIILGARYFPGDIDSIRNIF